MSKRVKGSLFKTTVVIRKCIDADQRDGILQCKLGCGHFGICNVGELLATSYLGSWTCFGYSITISNARVGGASVCYMGGNGSVCGGNSHGSVDIVQRRGSLSCQSEPHLEAYSLVHGKTCLPFDKLPLTNCSIVRSTPQYSAVSVRLTNF